MIKDHGGREGFILYGENGYGYVFTGKPPKSQLMRKLRMKLVDLKYRILGKQPRV